MPNTIDPTVSNSHSSPVISSAEVDDLREHNLALDQQSLLCERKSPVPYSTSIETRARNHYQFWRRLRTMSLLMLILGTILLVLVVAFFYFLWIVFSLNSNSGAASLWCSIVINNRVPQSIELSTLPSPLGNWCSRQHFQLDVGCIYA
jgi:hypothetical protein